MKNKIITNTRDKPGIFMNWSVVFYFLFDSEARIIRPQKVEDRTGIFELQKTVLQTDFFGF